MWIIGKVQVSMEVLKFTRKASKTNANTSVVKQGMLNCIPKSVIGLIIIYCIWALIKKIEKKSYKISIVCKMVCITILIGMNLKDYKRINNELDISGYLCRREEKTTLYEEHYISYILVNNSPERLHYAMQKLQIPFQTENNLS